MPYALSVFLPESGQQSLLSKPELIELLGLSKDDYFGENVGREGTPLLMDIVEVIRGNRSVRPNRQGVSVQTEDSSAFEGQMSLEQKLKQIDENLSSSERLMPYKSLEERMIKYKRELEAKFANDLETEVRRLREFEASRIRIEEA